MSNKNDKKVIRSNDVFYLEDYPYSQAIKAGILLFISGVLPINKNGETVGLGNILIQTTQVFENMKKIINEAGLEMEDIIKINMYMKNIEDLPRILDIRKKYFQKPYPCATGVGSNLIKEEWLIEIEAIANYQY